MITRGYNAKRMFLRAGVTACFILSSLCPALQCLAQAAPEIIGQAARIAVTGKFVDLCTSVAQVCGLPDDGIAKAIPPVVRKLRADQVKWRHRPAP